MNKKLCLGIALLSPLAPTVAFADDPTGPTVWDGFSGFLSPDWSRDFSATLGVKVWINDWSRDSFIDQEIESPATFAFVSDTSPDAQESNFEAVPIPQLSARYKWLFVTGSYFSKTQFEFDRAESGVFVDAQDPSGNIIVSVTTDTVQETSGERYEWDASAGIYVHPYVAILGGYKKVRQGLDFTFTATIDEDLPFDETEIRVTRISQDIDVEGPTIGIAGSVPIGRGFGMYGSYAHGFMDAKIRDVKLSPAPSDFRDPETDATYDVVEAGFSYTHGMESLAPHMPLSAATIYAGYRFQYINTEFDEPFQDRSDETRGFAVGVNLTF